LRTIVFTVHERPDPPLDRIERAEVLEFVPDGFSAFAAAIPPLWMAVNRLWTALLVYLLVSMGASLGLAMLGVDKGLIGLINLAANVIIGFEAPSLQRWTLGRRQWAEIGTVVGRNRAECERRFFDAWLDTQPLLRRSSFAPAPGSSQRPPKLVTPAAGPAPAASSTGPSPTAAASTSTSAGAGADHAFGLPPPGADPRPAANERPRSMLRRLLRR
jgi:hypothetical protein